jgi:N-acetyl-gamma-glutamyl-phosphate reductase
LAVPHTAAMQMAPVLLDKGINVVDLSADFRLRDPELYCEWYGVEHSAKDLLAKAVYGLPEINRADLQHLAERCGTQSGQSDKRAERHDKQPEQSDKQPEQHGKRPTPALIANPGCYPTASALALYPALASELVNTAIPIVINAISGVSGAGRKPTATTHFCAASDNINAYGATTHRHTPEIEQTFTRLAGGMAVKVVFTPHLAPLKRGMVATVTAMLNPGVNLQDIELSYTRAYGDKGEPFVQLLPTGTMPQSTGVQGSNNAHVGIAYDARAHALVASCAIDNLGKGAASQAIQNANILFGLEQTTGLSAIGQAV